MQCNAVQQLYLLSYLPSSRNDLYGVSTVD